MTKFLKGSIFALIATVAVTSIAGLEMAEARTERQKHRGEARRVSRRVDRRHDRRDEKKEEKKASEQAPAPVESAAPTSDGTAGEP